MTAKILDSSYTTTKDLYQPKIPKFLVLLFCIEAWERFSYYGMRALLILFLTSHLGFKDARAYAIYSLFAAISYATPVLGGFLADKFIGFRRMVLIGCIIIIMGHAAMVMINIEPDLVYFGLSLIAIGTGMFKGNIANLLGSCYKDNDPNRHNGFTFFYVSINLGGFIAAISCGYVSSFYGWNYGFGLAGIGMTIGLIIFLIFQSILERYESKESQALTNKDFGIFTPTIVVIVACITSACLVAKMLAYSDIFANIITIIGLIVLVSFTNIICRLPQQDRQNMIALSILIFFLMCFFAMEMQIGSIINLFTQRNVSNEIFGYIVPAAASQALNPLSIIILGCIIGTFVKFNKKHAILQYTLGLATLVICFFVLYIGCFNADEYGKVSYLYLLVAMFFMGFGELCIAPFVQAQATLLAPKGIKGYVMGVVRLSLAFANLSGIAFAKFISVPSANGEVNSLMSLEIYKSGFLDIAAFSLWVVAVFLLFCPFLHRVISREVVQRV